MNIEDKPKKDNVNVELLHEFDTGDYSDCVEWCPISGYHVDLFELRSDVRKSKAVKGRTINLALSCKGRTALNAVGFQHILVCGTYQLIEDLDPEDNPGDLQIRLGRLFLFKTSQNTKKIECIPTQDIDMPGILDMKWSHQTFNGGATLAIANSVGQILLLGLTSAEDSEDVNGLEGHNSSLAFGDRIDIRRDADFKTLALSLDWSNRRIEAEPKIAVSDSKGRVSIIDVATSKVDSTFDCHEYEAWICAFDYHDPTMVFSGGDDSKLKQWDLRGDPRNGPAFVNGKSHSAGVCSLQSNPFLENIFASGSYDETVAIWDRRSFRQPLSQTPVGGGVWRLKWDPTAESRLLAVCMHGGARVLRYEDFTSEGSFISSYHGHPTITYGGDINYADPHIISTSAFYDHQMHI